VGEGQRHGDGDEQDGKNLQDLEHDRSHHDLPMIE